MSLSRALLYDWDIEPYMYMNMPPNPDSCHRLKKKKKRRRKGVKLCVREITFVLYSVCVPRARGESTASTEDWGSQGSEEPAPLVDLF